MLQFDRQSDSRSKFIRGSNSKPPIDFLSRNKRAIRQKSRSQAAQKDATPAPKTNTRPRSKRSFERDTQQRRREERHDVASNGVSSSNTDVKSSKPAPVEMGSDTVTISKNYLEELLRMSIVKEVPHLGRDGVSNVPAGHGATSGGRDHTEQVRVEPTHIPGLDLSSLECTAPPPPPQQDRQRTEHAQKPSVAPQANNQGLSPQEKWLQDLALQVEEQKAKKEQNRRMQKQSTVEEYFPFGRPGGGAPIRTQSGQLLTDYRSRSRYDEQASKPERNQFVTSHTTQEHNTMYSQKEINYGRGISDNVVARDNSVARDSYAYSGGTYPQASVISGNSMTSPRHQQELPTPVQSSTTPRFARGAGPHVDEYMMKEINEKRRKQMEHMEFVRQQVAEKERAKMEEKLRREREEAMEEAKLAAERERMKADFEREKEKARRKELEARQRQALLQQRILEAEESARLAKLGARTGNIVTDTAHHPTVSFDEDCIRRLSGGDLIKEGVYSSLSKSDLRSPSMLQLGNTSNEGGYHEDSNAPPTQRGRGNAQRNTRQVVRNNADRAKGRVEVREKQGDITKNKTSRIPVIRQSPRQPGRTGNCRTRTGLKLPSQTVKTERNARSNKTSNRHFDREEERCVKMVSVSGRGVVERSESPPVPVVAKRIREKRGLEEKDVVALPYSSPSRTNEEDRFVRSDSPPIPVVARMLARGEVSGHRATEMVRPVYERALSPPVPAVARKLRDVGCGQEQTLTSESIPPVSYERTFSPPVPTIAKKLKEQDVDLDMSKTHTLTNKYANDRGSSPPVPAVAKRLHQDKAEQPSEVIALGNKSKSAPVAPLKKKARKEEGEKSDSDNVMCVSEIASSGDLHQFEINRAPSCDPDSKPLSPVAMTATSLPSIAMATSTHQHDKQLPMVPLQSSNRQRLILQQLTMLKEGILTQQNNIDHRVQTILSKNKQCNF